MKTRMYVMAVSAIVLCCSCGAKKMVRDYQYQQWAQQQSNPQRPTRTARTAEPCIELANSATEELRAYGTATSYNEKVALNEAERDARNRMTAMIKMAVEGAAQDYARNASADMKSTSETLGDVVMTQFFDAELQNTPVIKTSIYDLSDGSIQVYVCIEMRTKMGDLTKKLDNTLNRDGVMSIEYDRERFIEKMKDGLEDYKKRNKSAE